MELAQAVALLEQFKGRDLTATLSRIETSIAGKGGKSIPKLLDDYSVHQETLTAAGKVKEIAGQVNVMIHALGILACLPKLIEPDEIIESTSLGAGNTGKKFDLETNRRIAEFKFIDWRGGPEATRQNSLFKDFYGLAELPTSKSKHLYVLGTEIPLRFLNGRRALRSVLSKNVTLYQTFSERYPDCAVVKDYYLKKRDEVEIEDLMPYMQGVTEITLYAQG